MLRAFFDEVISPPLLTQNQINVSISVACQSFRSLIKEGYAEDENNEIFLDSIQLMNKLIDLKILNVRSLSIPY